MEAGTTPGGWRMTAVAPLLVAADTRQSSKAP